VLGVTRCNNVWSTATLGRTGWWGATALGSSAGSSARGACAHDDGAARGVAALARGGSAGASRLESTALWCGLDGTGTCAGVNGGVRRVRGEETA
jgi:hypothetical protein